MTNRRQEIKERLLREFAICDRHILRIHEAVAGLSNSFPMQPEYYANLNAEQIRCIDQFIFRFSKLQDAMGAKIFRHILELWDEDISSLPMRDILNRLERYLIIPSASDWIYIRELRNEIAHDYPIDEKDTVAVLNELVAKTGVLLDIYARIKECFVTGQFA